MKIRTILIVFSSLTIGAVDAFVVAPAWHTLQQPFSSRRFVTMSPTSSNSDATIHEESGPYENVLQLNQALSQLGYFVGGKQRSLAISRAASCQEEWEKYKNHPLVQPDIASFNTVLKAWSRCCYSFPDTLSEQPSGEGNGDKSDWLDQTTDVSVYTNHQAAERALSLLDEQEEMSNQNTEAVRPDVTSYNICLSCWSKIKRPEGVENAERLLARMKENAEIQPDEDSYIALIEAYAISKRIDREDKVLQLYAEMQESSDPKLRPSARTMNAILLLYSRLGEVEYVKEAQESSLEDSRVSVHAAATECLAILKRMKESYAKSSNEIDRPDITSYNTVMEALSRCGSIGMTKKTEELLAEIKESSHLEPIPFTYSTVVTAWSRTKNTESCERAEALLKEALDMGLASTRTFTAVIRAWSRSYSISKAVRCLELLKQMKQLEADGNLDVAPSAMSYFNVIDTCARTRGSAEQQNAALRIAFAVFKAMQLDKSVQVSHALFSKLLNAVYYLLPNGKERNQVAKALFEKAIVAGQVDDGVIWHLQKTADGSAVEELLAPTRDEYGRFKKIPVAWNKNVR
jgi:hypothetical protein